VERPSSPGGSPDDSHDDRSSALELKGITTPPPSSAAALAKGATRRGGRS
jgi:hypothetical protein